MDLCACISGKCVKAYKFQNIDKIERKKFANNGTFLWTLAPIFVSSNDDDEKNRPKRFFTDNNGKFREFSVPLDSGSVNPDR